MTFIIKAMADDYAGRLGLPGFFLLVLIVFLSPQELFFPHGSLNNDFAP